jgi:muconolactone D-isomerase
MLFMLKSHISKPESLSNKEFYGVWLKEAEAAVAAHKSGAIKGIWKVAGKPEVVSVLDVDSADALESAVLNFPFWKLGYSHVVKIEWNVLRPYENWYEDLKKLAVEQE